MTGHMCVIEHGFRLIYRVDQGATYGEIIGTGWASDEGYGRQVAKVTLFFFEIPLSRRSPLNLGSVLGA